MATNQPTPLFAYPVRPAGVTGFVSMKDVERA